MFFFRVWVFVCLFVEVLVRCSVSTIWRLRVNWWRLRNEPRHVNDPQTLVKANAQDSWTSQRLLKTLLTWRELTSCRLPRLLLTSITGKRVFPAFSHAFWCILQLVIHEKPNNLWSIHTRITWSIFPDIFSSSVASMGKLGHPWHLNNASCKQARDMRSLCSHINTPQSSSQTPSTKFCRQKNIFNPR